MVVSVPIRGVGVSYIFDWCSASLRRIDNQKQIKLVLSCIDRVKHRHTNQSLSKAKALGDQNLKKKNTCWSVSHPHRLTALLPLDGDVKKLQTRLTMYNVLVDRDGSRLDDEPTLLIGDACEPLCQLHSFSPESRGNDTVPHCLPRHVVTLLALHGAKGDLHALCSVVLACKGSVHTSERHSFRLPKNYFAENPSFLSLSRQPSSKYLD